MVDVQQAELAADREAGLSSSDDHNIHGRAPFASRSPHTIDHPPAGWHKLPLGRLTDRVGAKQLWVVPK
jgi:hypothetical protein